MVTILVRGILLSALLVNIVPSVWAQESKGVGVVTALTGRAQLKRPQAPQSVALKLRDDLNVRDIVETREESLTRILLLGKSTVTVRELSRFEIREEILADGAQRAVIDLAEGKMRVMVARRLMKPGDEVRIRTPNAVAGVRGSDGIVEVTTLPDGRPQTVVIGVSGEFELTLPRARPVTAMADAVSDAGSGALLAQLPGVTTIQTGQRWDIIGYPPLQQAFQSFVSDLAPVLRDYRGKSVASGTVAQSEPESVKLAVEEQAVALARSQVSTFEILNGLGIGRPSIPRDVVMLPVTGKNNLVPPGRTDTQTTAIVTAPFHIQVIWGPGGRDLDLHLTGPQNSERFHLYYSNMGSLEGQPFARLHQDCICSAGSEVITVGRFNQGGVYRASVHDYPNRNSTTSTTLSTAAEAELRVIQGGNVADRPGGGSVVNGGTTVTAVRPPAGQAGNTWRAAEINPATGRVTTPNQILNSPNPGAVQ